jgi:hypothetical protein
VTAPPLDRPYPPFDTWPIQVADRRFGYAWFTAPCTFVDQAHVERATLAAVHALHDALDDVIVRQAASIEAQGGLLVLHDWRRVKGYEKGAREAYLDRMRARDKGYLRNAVTVLPNTPLLRMAVQTANLLMALKVGGDLELYSNIEPALAKHRIEAPPQ